MMYLSRGIPTPPPVSYTHLGTEGGENLELSPSQKTSVRYQFESYCKKVIRGERCDYLREVLRRAEKEICFSDLPEGILMQMGISADYHVEHLPLIQI